ncbi:GNAT family N-acetyltransferase [Bryobacter aggregatus]|uniref:GNAT family N-acetyltransferase n=1 Tax=Bryobacter aggregatus TaxID=360054 RepID=UPI0004E111DB|nr:GNAT family N-acetyltransferase [Bryobacter aggregatus]
MESPKTILTPQPLTVFPLPALQALSIEAGWNQTGADWQRLLKLAPALCLGIEHQGELVASATAITYEDKLAWIGMVLTRPSFRGRGAAHTLVTALLDRLSGYTIKLDATAAGAEIYRKLGFVAEQPIERWRRLGQAPQIHSRAPYDPSLDAKAMGANRAELLQELAADSAVWSASDGSFAMLRPGREIAHLGPLIATSKATARNLLSRIPTQSGCYWDLFPEHPDAPQLAAELGFQPIRHLLRMTRTQTRQPQDWQLAYATAGFELG